MVKAWEGGFAQGLGSGGGHVRFWNSFDQCLRDLLPKKLAVIAVSLLSLDRFVVHGWTGQNGIEIAWASWCWSRSRWTGSVFIARYHHRIHHRGSDGGIWMNCGPQSELQFCLGSTIELFVDCRIGTVKCNVCTSGIGESFDLESGLWIDSQEESKLKKRLVGIHKVFAGVEKVLQVRLPRPLTFCGST